ncbi:Ger(x)C family spore germination protein [Paenibacillus thalictri]|uniref:Ger(X)C family spore germination protein n=1 Tax=Paenibacillus thalictri TaxID=2527873 RepID=A0A4Q9DU14_9BACL|nr:Ger(x)C family spore germination protein [Paenibacillus thalictri]TBL80408.1 Ger(x)C family spore germination protein [Paenibacillus thalictri]
MKKHLLLLLLLSTSLLSGCWDIHNIENTNYVSAMGFDYVNNEYIMYTQVLDFGAVSRQMGAKSNTPASTWVGKGKGPTVNMAANDLYSSAQEKIIWSHVTAVVLSERVIRHGIEELNDGYTRYRENRFIPWIYGTQENMEQLFTTSAFFNLSGIATILHDPLEIFRQHSMIPPVHYMSFIADYFEPGKSAILPTLGINNNQWARNGMPDTKLEINGAFVLNHGQLQGWLNEDQLKGRRWLAPETKRTPLGVETNNKVAAVISLENPVYHIGSRIVSGQPVFSIRIRLKGNVTEMDAPIGEEELQRLAEETVKQEVLSTFKQALQRHVDIYQLENSLYKDHYKVWKQLANSNSFDLKESSLADVNVAIRLVHTGLTTGKGTRGDNK